jgi:TatD DNase family protein
MTDSHAHLDQPAFNPDRGAVLARAVEAGVSTVVSIGMLDGDASWKETFSLVDALHREGSDHSDPAAPQLFTTLGCHPHDARLFGELGGEERLMELARRPRLLAIGEVGLDYHYDLSPRPEQRDVFRRQIRVARELGLPVVVHHRDAEDDFLRVADEEDLAECGAVLHCFTASERLARAASERGFLISFSGILTFKNAEDLRRTAAVVPLDHLLVETDSPYLAPVPHRGRRAEPAMVVETARCLAAVRSADPAEIEAATDANFRRFFFGARGRPSG